MTDKQQGWNDALEIVLDTFRDFAWQKEQGDERERAALDMEKQVKHKCREKPGEYYQQTMVDMVTPFCEMLKGKSPSRSLPSTSRFPKRRNGAGTMH